MGIYVTCPRLVCEEMKQQPFPITLFQHYFIIAFQPAMYVCLPKPAMELHFALVKTRGLDPEKTDSALFLNDLASPSTRESQLKKALQRKKRQKKQPNKANPKINAPKSGVKSNT